MKAVSLPSNSVSLTFENWMNLRVSPGRKVSERADQAVIGPRDGAAAG